MNKNNIRLDPMYKKVWGIYKITNIKNGKIYIGSSKNLYKRINNHFSSLKSNKHENSHLQYSYNKYGENSFKSEVLKTFSDITDKELRNEETKLIQYYKSYDSSNGYNISRVGSGTSSEEFTEERKHKISESNKGRVAHNKGIKMSDSQRNLLKKVDTEKFGKKVVEYDRVGNKTNIYNSITEAAKNHNVIKRDIIDVCRGRRSFVHNYIFRYVDNENLINFDRNYFINKFSSNISYGAPFYYLVENLLDNSRKIFYSKLDVEKFIGLPNKSKILQEKFKILKSGTDETSVIVNNFSIRFIYALSNSDIAKEVRQLGLKV